MSEAPIMSDLMFSFVVNQAATGSRIICNPPPKDTDYDILVLVKDVDQFKVAAALSDWRNNTSEKKDEYQDAPDFTSFRKGELNLIVTSDQGFYERFDAATHVAKRLNLLKKPDRIALFQAVLYANKWEEPPSAAECRAEMRGL